jgi:hypothetical protein
MKKIALFVMSAALAIATGAPETDSDPVASFKQLVAAFPTQGVIHSAPANVPVADFLRPLR